MKTIKLKLENNVLSLLPDQEVKQIVCNNENYQIEVQFDSEWQGYADKKARFIYNGIEVVGKFENNICPIPKLLNTTEVLIGIFSKDDNAASTSVGYPCSRSILCIRAEEKRNTKGEDVIRLGNTEINEDQLKMLLDTLRYDIEGTWKFNFSYLTDIIDEEVSFISVDDGLEFKGIKAKSDGLYYVLAKEQFVPSYEETYPEGYELSIMNEEATLHVPYETITFNGTQKVTYDFLDFMNRNATKMITFYLYDDEFSCPAGMTWAEFVNSKYNTNSYFCIREDNAIAIHCADEGTHIDDGDRDEECWERVSDDSDYVAYDDEIINNYQYSYNLG